MSSLSTPSVARSTEDDNPFAFTTEIIILLGVALGLLSTLIVCCCCIVRKRKEKTMEVTPSGIQEGRVTPSQLLDAGMSPQSVVEVGAATPSQLVDQGLARPHEVDLRSQAGVPIHPGGHIPPYPLCEAHPGGHIPPYPFCEAHPGHPGGHNPSYPFREAHPGHPGGHNPSYSFSEAHPARLGTPDELLRAGFTPSQLSTYSVVHRNKEQEKAKTTVVGSDETLKKALSNGPKRVVVEPSQGTIYTGPIKRVVKDDTQTEICNPKSRGQKTARSKEGKKTARRKEGQKNVRSKEGKKTDVTNTLSTWMSTKAGKKNESKTLEPSTVLSSYKQLGRDETPGRVVVVESTISRKGSMATDVNELKESKMMPQTNVSKVKTVSPRMKTHRGSNGGKMVSKTISKRVLTKSMSPRTNKKGSSKYDVED